MASGRNSSPFPTSTQYPNFTQPDQYAYTCSIIDLQVTGRAVLRRHNTRPDGAYVLVVETSRRASAGSWGARQRERAHEYAKMAEALMLSELYGADWTSETVNEYGRLVILYYPPRPAQPDPAQPDLGAAQLGAPRFHNPVLWWDVWYLADEGYFRTVLRAPGAGRLTPLYTFSDFNQLIGHIAHWDRPYPVEISRTIDPLLALALASSLTWRGCSCYCRVDLEPILF